MHVPRPTVGAGTMAAGPVRALTALLLLGSALLVVALVDEGSAFAVPGSGRPAASPPPVVAVGHASLDAGSDPVGWYEQAVTNASLVLSARDPQVGDGSPVTSAPGTALPAAAVGAGTVAMRPPASGPQAPDRPAGDVQPHWAYARPGDAITVAAEGRRGGPGDAGRGPGGPPASQPGTPAVAGASATVQAGRDAAAPRVVPAGITQAPDGIAIDPPPERLARTLPGGLSKSHTGEITLEDGTRVLRTGEVVWSDGTRILASGVRVRPDGTQVPAEGADNSRRLADGTSVLVGGWILSPDGSVTDRYGNHYGGDGTTRWDDARITQFANGAVKYDDDGVVETPEHVLFFPDGTIKFPWPNGLVIYPDDSIQRPTWRVYDSGMQYAGGWVEYEDRYTDPEGKTHWRDGRVTDLYGDTTYPGGIMRFRDGHTEYPDRVEHPTDSGSRPVDYTPVTRPLHFVPPQPDPADYDAEARDQLIETRAQPEPEPEPGQPQPGQPATSAATEQPGTVVAAAVPTDQPPSAAAPSAPDPRPVVNRDPPPAGPPAADQGVQPAAGGPGIGGTGAPETGDGGSDLGGLGGDRMSGTDFGGGDLGDGSDLSGSSLSASTFGGFGGGAVG